jgi:hypothetical protein
MVVKICFQQSAQVGMGHRFSEALSCIPLGPAFYFLAKILPLGDIKNREGLPPLYRVFLGGKKKKNPKFRHISRKKVMSLPYLDFRSLPVHSRVSKKKNLLVFLSSVARFG